MLSESDNLLDIPINFCDLVEYCGSKDKRIFVEGEKVLQANHVIHVDVDQQDNNKILGSVVNTSCLKGKPHSVQIIIEKNFPNWNKKCSCVAGQGSHCKHIFAVLLFIYRIQQLPVLTTTDYQQYWGVTAAKEKYSNLYTPKPLKNFCCAKMKNINKYNISEEIKNKNFNLISSIGAIKIHYEQSRQTKQNIVVPDKNNNDEISNFKHLEFVYNSLFSMDLLNPDGVSCTFEHFGFYIKNVCVSTDEALDLAKRTVSQSNSVVWRKERSKRITGSICYAIYTYSSNKNPNWKRKLDTVFSSASKSNLRNLIFGKLNEPKALKKYFQIYPEENTPIGLVVHPAVPWLGFSPDGFISNSKTLIEIKCPVVNSDVPMRNVLKKSRFLYEENETFYLKEKHPYYGQVQLGLFLLNIELCHLVIYHAVIDEIVVINVIKNSDFLDVMIPILKNTYFTKCLPYIYEKTNFSIN